MEQIVLTKNQTLGFLTSIVIKPPTKRHKQIPNSIQERLSKNSSNEEIFNLEKCEQEDALKANGFKVDFKYTTNNNRNKKNRLRNIIRFNPPFNKAVSINVAKNFLRLINKHFPRSHRLHKNFQQKHNEDQLQLYAKCVDNVQKGIIVRLHSHRVTN